MKHTMHDPRLHKLPYPRNLMLAIAKADLTDSTMPIVELDGQFEGFVRTQLENVLTDTEYFVICRHYMGYDSLSDIAKVRECTSENIRLIRNRALNRLLKEYLKVNEPVNEPVDELPTLDPQIISEIKHQFDYSTLTPAPKHIKAAKNSIKKYRAPRSKKQLIPRKFYVRSDGILYLELQDELNQHYIGEFYTYSNSNFQVEGIVVDISLAGILLNDWEVTHT